VANPLAGFQDAHNGRLGLVVAVCGDALVGFLVLGGGLFELDCVDLDAVFGVAEGGVEREGVGGGDFAPFGVFSQRPDLGAREGLEGAVELCGGLGSVSYYSLTNAVRGMGNSRRPVASFK
jgi:hypothetical protein